MIEILQLLANPIFKLVQFIYSKNSLSNELENTKKDIEYLNLINVKDMNLEDSLKDLVYRRKYGVPKSKFEFFKNNSKLENDIDITEYKTLSLFTYKEKNTYKVKMKIVDRLLYYTYSIIGFLLLSSSLIVIKKVLLNNSINFSEVIDNQSLQKNLLLIILCYILGLICLLTYLKPILIFRKYKRLNR